MSVRAPESGGRYCCLHNVAMHRSPLLPCPTAALPLSSQSLPLSSGTTYCATSSPLNRRPLRRLWGGARESGARCELTRRALEGREGAGQGACALRGGGGREQERGEVRAH